jgi:DNA (cytosine-5)-methyltransferase 1
MDRNARPLNEVIVNLLPSPVSRDYKGVPGKNVQMSSLPREVSLLPTPIATDYLGSGATQNRERNGKPRPPGDMDLPEAVSLLPTPSAGVFNDGEDLASWEARRQENLAKGINGNGQGTPLSIAVQQDWGRFEPAIRHWEIVMGRPAPEPTAPGKTAPRLSEKFVEFLMGLPEGWVCDTPGLSRKEKLHALGNGVVPQQAAMALRILLERKQGE